MSVKILIRLILTFTLTLTAARALAGPLRLMAPGGPVSAFGHLTYSEGDADLMRPASLIDSASGSLSFTKEFENVIHQTKAGRTLNHSTAGKTRIDFSIPINRNPKYRSAYAGNRYTSTLRFFSNDYIGDTTMDSKGLGSSNAFAQQIGRFTLGYFKNHSRENGDGISAEVNDRIEFLDATAPMFALMQADREGKQVSFSFNKRLSASFLESDEDYYLRLNFKDTVDDYMIPGELRGERRELGMDYAVSRRWSLKTFYNHASYDSLDDIMYNTTQNIGRWLSAAEYDSRSFYLYRQPSPNRKQMFGYEDYDGYFRMAGYIDVLGTQADLIAGYYLFHAHGTLHRETYKYSMERRKKDFVYRMFYSYTSGGAFLHYDAYQRTFLTWNLKANENLNYDITIHQLGLGVEKEVRKNTVLKYSLIQTVPIMDKTEAAPAPSATPATTVVKKKSRGGTLHLMSLVFNF